MTKLTHAYDAAAATQCTDQPSGVRITLPTAAAYTLHTP